MSDKNSIPSGFLQGLNASEKKALNDTVKLYNSTVNELKHTRDKTKQNGLEINLIAELDVKSQQGHLDLDKMSKAMHKYLDSVEPDTASHHKLPPKPHTNNKHR